LTFSETTQPALHIPPNGQQSVDNDGGSAIARFGTTKAPFLKLDEPDVDVKTEKIRRIGEMRATVRTPGAEEIGDLAAEMLLTDYVSIILPRMSKHGGTLIEFPVTLNHRHPAVSGSFSILFDQCRIVKLGGTIENGEKALIKKLGISVMQVWEKGGDGIWKCLSLEPTLPSVQASALMDF